MNPYLRKAMSILELHAPQDYVDAKARLAEVESMVGRLEVLEIDSKLAEGEQ